GIKLARPRLRVIVAMGDGGIGIGGAHFLEACRRNLDLTLLVLNNFNFGMTGGQFSSTTPSAALVASGFLNRIEKPMDVCSIAAAAGAPFVSRSSVYARDLPRTLADAVVFEGFSVVDIWGPCTGRFTRRNPMKPEDIEAGIRDLPVFNGPIESNRRPEYGGQYRVQRELEMVPDLAGLGMDAVFPPPVKGRREVVLLGAAGSRIISTGSLLAHAAVMGGMHATQKNDHDVTVMRGPSVSEIILSPNPIGYTGVEDPDVIIAVSQEGISRKRDLFSRMSARGRLLAATDVEIPPCSGATLPLDFKAHGIRKSERALVALFLLAQTKDPITADMLAAAMERTLSGKALEESRRLLDRAAAMSATF
ncbi:MAG: 2-oxoglutarate synthase, partial [Syntrophobacteraceae bacterium]|nr:2-oxoglutarate synthase [Syntrophobacteraceae bacterium]